MSLRQVGIGAASWNRLRRQLKSAAAIWIGCESAAAIGLGCGISFN
jgi:hypothetical protein